MLGQVITGTQDTGMVMTKDGAAKAGIITMKAGTVTAVTGIDMTKAAVADGMDTPKVMVARHMYAIRSIRANIA